MEKIDRDLLDVLERRERAHADASARGDQAALALVDAPIEVRVAFDGDAATLQAAGFPLYSVIPDVARGGLSPSQIKTLAARPEVHHIGIPIVMDVQLDRSVPEIKAVDAWAAGIGSTDVAKGKGKEIVVGIIDSGFDVFHGAFLDPERTPRIVRLWDQTFRYDPGTGVPVDSTGAPITGDLTPRDEVGNVLTVARAPTDINAAFNYGAAFGTFQIKAALALHPDGKDLPISLRDQPVGSGNETTFHGTHVAGIAAGNGAQNDRCTNPFTYVGVAPQADLVLVKTSVGGGQANRISNLTQAVQFIFGVASRLSGGPLGRPCVINISLGGHFGPHNGQSDEAVAFDTLTSGILATGRAIVIAAGNDRNKDLHAAFTVAQGTTQTVRVNLKDTTATQVVLFGSCNANATLTCVVREPLSGAVQQTAALPLGVTSNARVAFGAHDVIATRHATNGTDPDRHFYLWIREPAGRAVRSGVWELDFTASAAANANIHLWVSSPAAWSTEILPFVGAVPSAQDASRAVKRPADWIASTLTSIATSRRAITVAAYSADETNTPLADFSSQGPAPNNLTAGLYNPADVIAKPDIAAPGVAIDAPRGEARKCCLECDCCVDRYVAEQGTSMAAPHITGVIALMLARNPILTTDEIKQKLRATRRPPPPSPPGWPAQDELWGAGKVDAKAAAESAVIREGESPVSEESPSPLVVPTPAILPVSWPERLRGWNQILGPHPAWNVFAALVSLHFDEVKRLIDTNRRVAAVWQRYGGPALVRTIAFSERPPDPPVPAALAQGELIARLLKVLVRFGGEKLRADIVRYGELTQTLPGASWSELDALVMKGAQK